jgi:hypothetical protein
MTNRLKVWIAVLPALIISGIMLVHFLSIEQTKTFSQEYIQQKVNEKLPKPVAFNRFKVTSAKVELTDQAVKVLIDVEGNKTGNMHAVVSAIGRPRYNRNTAEFFFEPDAVTVEQIDWKGQKPSDVIGSAIGTQTAVFAQRFETWLISYSQTIAISTLQEIPVFKIKDEMKWAWVIKSSLKQVEIKNGQLVVTFSILNLTLSVLFFFLIALACVGLAIAMIANPALFLGVGILSAIG